MSTPNLPDSQKNFDEYIREYHNEFLDGGVGFSDYGTAKRYDEIIGLLGYDIDVDIYESVLEVGCGPNGGFFKHVATMTDASVRDYTGIDINESFIESSNKFKDGEFIHANILEDELPHEKYDHVIASGIFCYAYENAETANMNILHEMTLRANHTVVANFIPTTAPGGDTIKANGILQYDVPMLMRMIHHAYLPDDWGYSIIADKYPNNITLVLRKF